jgi:hypothetical protein
MSLQVHRVLAISLFSASIFAGCLVDDPPAATGEAVQAIAADRECRTVLRDVTSNPSPLPVPRPVREEIGARIPEPAEPEPDDAPPGEPVPVAAPCSLGWCDAKTCRLECTAAPEYILAGRVEKWNGAGWTPVGYGTCSWTADVHFEPREPLGAAFHPGKPATEVLVVDAGDGNDLLRLADPECEECGTDVRICGATPGDAVLQLEGGGGDDVLELCDRKDPAATDCLARGGVIDGGDGADIIHGSVLDDTLYGGAGDDAIFGYDGRDLIFGNAGDDRIFGGNGDDTLYGSGGLRDECYGEGGELDDCSAGSPHSCDIVAACEKP